MGTYGGIGEIPLVAGHPALDLVNTVEPRVPGAAPVLDHLDRPVDVLVWARRAGLMTDREARQESAAWAAATDDAGPDGDLGRGALEGVRALRDALHRVLAPRAEGRAASTPEATAALGVVHAGWVEAVGRSRLRPAAPGDDPFPATCADLVIGAQPGQLLLDRVAEAAVDLLTRVDLAALRACPPGEGGCGWLFLDRSRARSRRWCVMEDCGARAKARRLNDRRRAARAAAHDPSAR